MVFSLSLYLYIYKEDDKKSFTTQKLLGCCLKQWCSWETFCLLALEQNTIVHFVCIHSILLQSHLLHICKKKVLLIMMYCKNKIIRPNSNFLLMEKNIPLHP